MVKTVRRIALGPGTNLIVDIDPDRTSLRIKNTSLGAHLDIGSDPEVSAGRGWPLQPDEVLELKTQEGDRPDQAWYVVDGGGPIEVAIIEQFRGRTYKGKGEVNGSE